MIREAALAPAGNVGLRVVRPFSTVPAKALDLREVVRHGIPQRGLSPEINAWRFKNLTNLYRGLRKVMVARALKIPHMYGQLSLVKVDADGRWEELGLASLRVVTTAGVGFIVDAFQNLVETENMKFHAIGTGAVAEAVGDTTLGTELTTQYNPDNTRATGTTAEGAANIYRSVGTNTVDAAVTITEHGILTQAATGGGVLLDRSVFSAVNLASAESLQTTYDLTFNAGG